jgi:hypothetical protein
MATPRGTISSGVRSLRASPQNAAAALTRVMAGFALALGAATWPLWLPQQPFPRVPLVAAFGDVPAWLDATVAAISGLALLAVLVSGNRLRTGGIALLVFAGCASLLVLADQHRFQPWLYQFVVLAVLLSALPPAAALSGARVLTISIYAYSALSKLDRTFIESGGGQIMEGLFVAIGRDAGAIGPVARGVLAGCLPVLELVVAGGLCLRRTRRGALAASVVLHLVLLGALGPFGARNQIGVLLWNVFFIVQNVILFGAPAASSAVPAGEPARIRRRLAESAAMLLLALVVAWPLGEPWGLCDVWPAWAVYATRPERLRVYVDAGDRQRLPEAVRLFAGQPRFADGRCPLRIDRWSLAATRAPLYPQNRFRLGVVLGLSDAAGLSDRIHVELDGPADRWTGRRETRALDGRASVEAELAGSWLNGLPRR